jgi:hypothetical protein
LGTFWCGKAIGWCVDQDAATIDARESAYAEYDREMSVAYLCGK